MTIIFVQKFGCGSDISTNSAFPATVESLQFQIGGHEKVDELSVSSSTGSACIDIGCNIVNFLAVLLHNNGSSGSSGISSQHNTAVVLDSYNGCACLLMWDGMNDMLIDEEFVSSIKKLNTFEWVTDRIHPFVRCKPEDEPLFKNILNYFIIYIFTLFIYIQLHTFLIFKLVCTII